MPDRPNIVVLITDQQRADHLGCVQRALASQAPGEAGRARLQTPNLDRLASEGVRFDRAYVNNPLCMPSRATLLTGLTPRGHGVRTNGIPLSPTRPTIVEALRTAGYRTHAVGKMHLHSYGLPTGADPDRLDPLSHPESRSMWVNGRISELPLPYHGFETADFTGGHGGYIFGHYLNWLRREHPEAEPLLLPAAGRPSRSAASQTYAMALPPGLHYNTWCTDRAIAFLKNNARAGRPFMLWCSYPDPHHPFCAPEPFASLYGPADVAMPTRRDGELNELAPHFRAEYEGKLRHSGKGAPSQASDDQLREMIAMTWGMVTFVDQEIGRVLDALDQLGLTENTLVVFLSDHGELLGDHWIMHKGPFHFDGLLRVPFIWRWPGHFPTGVTVESPASLLDFAPTILDLAGVPIPEWASPPEVEAPKAPRPWPGVSLVPLLTGGRERVRDAVVVENDEDYLGLRLRTLVTCRYQLTLYVSDLGEEPYGELFDLEADPAQVWNLWDRPEAQAVKHELKERLLIEMIRSDLALPRKRSHA